MARSNVLAIAAQAKELSKQITTESDAIARLALLHPDAALQAKLVRFKGGRAEFSLQRTSDVFGGAGKAFQKAKQLVIQIVCNDLKYCQHEGSVSDWLNTNLPTIIGQLLKGSPKGIVAKILGLLGIGAASWAAVVAIVVAWLLKTEIDRLCGCKAR